MNKQQEYLLKMLKEIHAICQANDIKYFIGMGTLIGAVRNGGFLPWDDDADLLMTYPEYEKFKKVCADKLPANRFLGTADTQESYRHLLPRYVSRDTTSIHTCQSLHDDVAGEIIDIFVLDPIADGDEAYDSYIQDLYLYSAVENYANAAGTRFEIDADRFKRYKDLEDAEGKLAVAVKLEEKLASHFDDNGSRYAFRWQGAPICFERSWFEEAVPIRFEDTTLMAPKGINEFLTCYYGEEWPDIPGAITATKHNTAASLAFPYTEALEYYRPTLDREKLLADTVERRYLCFKNAHQENALKDATSEAKAAMIAAETIRRVNDNRDAFDRAVASNDGNSLAQLLHDYIAWQTNAEMIGRHADKTMYRYAHPILMDVPDDIVEAAMIACFQTDRIRFVSRLLEIRRLKGLAITPRMQKLEDSVAMFNDSASAYQYGRHEHGLILAQELLADTAIPHPAIILRLACAHAGKIFEQDPTSDNGARFLDLVKRGRALFPTDGTFAKLEGDYLWNTGEKEEATNLYLTAAESTRNGLSLNDIAAKTGYHPSWLRNAPWAKAAGVPQWDAETPQPLQSPDSDGAPSSPETQDACIMALASLLDEVCARAESLGINYVLGADAAYAIAEQHRYPDRVTAFSIVVAPDDLLKLLDSFQESLPENRAISYMGSKSTAKSFALRYCDTSTAYVCLKKKIDWYSSLNVTIIPLEPQSYPRAMNRLVSYWRNGKASDGIKGSLLKQYASFKGVKPSSTESGEKLLRDVMIYAASANPDCITLNGAQHPFDIAFLTHAVTVTHDGKPYRIPVHLGAYLKALPHKPSGMHLTMQPSYLASPAISAKQLIASGAIPKDLYKRYAKLKKDKARSNEILKHFRQNYSQIKLAVQLKEVSLEILPQKDRIIAASKSGDTVTLANLLANYIKVANAFKGVGDLSFDDQIYDALLKVWKP